MFLRNSSHPIVSSSSSSPLSSSPTVYSSSPLDSYKRIWMAGPPLLLPLLFHSGGWGGAGSWKMGAAFSAWFQTPTLGPGLFPLGTHTHHWLLCVCLFCDPLLIQSEEVLRHGSEWSISEILLHRNVLCHQSEDFVEQMGVIFCQKAEGFLASFLLCSEKRFKLSVFIILCGV